MCLAPACLRAGPLLDDYLNHLRVGGRALPGGKTLELSEGAPLGQTFAVAAGTAEIYRIGLYADPDTWADGQAVTLTLYDSPGKRRRIGACAIDAATCRTDGLRGHEKDRLLLFPLRQNPLEAPEPGELPREMYFELAVTGGPGAIRFRAADRYPAGALHIAGRAADGDIAFETHVKPVPDRVANLKAMLALFDLSRPELAEVRPAVDGADWDEALARLANHFHTRMDIWDSWKDLYTPKPDPGFDRTAADRFLEGYVRAQDGRWVPWRKQSYWAPDWNEKYGREWGPKGYTWHIERMLAGAYSSTADPKYARAAIDNRMQWLLDNSPNPEVTGIEAPHQIWNELAANGRAPGHGDLPYARMYNYPGWTNDERVLWILSFYDSADFGCDSDKERDNGGNWLVQTAETVRNFGLRFPEFRKSSEFVSWGNHALANEALANVRADGTNNEAAIKYHAMIARRLKSLLEDEASGLITIRPDLKERLVKALTGMYEHMAYVLQPDNRVVMYGDSWYEDYAGEVADVARRITNRPDILWIATQGREGRPPEEVSRAFLDGGIYIMRSDFGGAGVRFGDARQLFVHNGGWVGSHGHFGLLGVNLFAYGRTLIIDPGGMWQPSSGDPYYWKSSVHSTLVANGWDMSRDPGPSRWVSLPGFDYLDGVHYGYARHGVPEVRRRIVFVKPGHFVVSDSAQSEAELEWDQVWNLLAAGDEVRTGPESQVIETLFRTGGNLIIHPVGDGPMEVVTRSGEVSMDGMRPTTVKSYRSRGSKLRRTTVLFPYVGARPALSVTRTPAPGSPDGLSQALTISHSADVDFVAFGDPARGKLVFTPGRNSLDGELLTVRTSRDQLQSFGWYNARQASYAGRQLARSGQSVAVLDVSYQHGAVTITAREPDPSLEIWTGAANRIIVNGSVLSRPKIAGGYLRPFALSQHAIVVDDSSAAFRRITQTREWDTISDRRGYGLSYTVHETDPGRQESAAYSATIPAAGRYRVEVFVPPASRAKSDRVEYAIKGALDLQASVKRQGSSVVDTEGGWGGMAVTLDQTKADGEWVILGEARFKSGAVEFLTVTNKTSTDGSYPVFDAVRLVSVRK